MPRQRRRRAFRIDLDAAAAELANHAPARDLRALVEIVENVQDLMTVRNVHDRPIRKYPTHRFREHFPLPRAVEVVRHHEAAA